MKCLKWFGYYAKCLLFLYLLQDNIYVPIIDSYNMIHLQVIFTLKEKYLQV